MDSSGDKNNCTAEEDQTQTSSQVTAEYFDYICVFYNSTGPSHTRGRRLAIHCKSSPETLFWRLSCCFHTI